MDDKAAGAEIHYLRSRGLSDEIAYTDSPDFTAVAKALDFDAYTVDNVDELATVFAKVLAGPKGPVMITVAIDSEEMNDWYNSFSSSIETVRGWSGV
jgi:thiamine pyrophosphate-dependent acetolactate synthase large subunit-like protein